MITQLETVIVPQHVIIGFLDNVSVGHPGLLLVQKNIGFASVLVKLADDRQRERR